MTEFPRVTIWNEYRHELMDDEVAKIISSSESERTVFATFRQELNNLTVSCSVTSPSGTPNIGAVLE